MSWSALGRLIASSWSCVHFVTCICWNALNGSVSISHLKRLECVKFSVPIPLSQLYSATNRYQYENHPKLVLMNQWENQWFGVDLHFIKNSLVVKHWWHASDSPSRQFKVSVADSLSEHDNIHLNLRMGTLMGTQSPWWFCRLWVINFIQDILSPLFWQKNSIKITTSCHVWVPNMEPSSRAKGTNS